MEVRRELRAPDSDMELCCGPYFLAWFGGVANSR